MARIVLATTGTAGDINPFVALGIGLRARGHDVVFATEARSGASVAAAGFPIHQPSGGMMTAVAATVAPTRPAGKPVTQREHPFLSFHQ
jgi:UDP:flavonoid glycosyltransferase YjiC (YdhE family)